MVTANEKANILGGTLTGIGILLALSNQYLSIFQGSPIQLALASGAFSFIGLTLIMNKGSKYIVNLFAQKEPLLFALGTSMIALSGPTMTATTTYLLPAGAIFITISLLSRYTTLMDF